MKKLRLDLENLKVDSFATTPEMTAAKGTVFGQDTDSCPYTNCGQYTCW